MVVVVVFLCGGSGCMYMEVMVVYVAVVLLLYVYICAWWLWFIMEKGAT